MTTTTARGLARIVAAAALTVAALAGWSSSVSAGGWAVASLDSIPTAHPGATGEVSFTILQHGVSPVDLDEDVGIEIRDDAGIIAFFPAVGSGPTGHYVATVRFPEAAGTYPWSVRMGWFGPHELGTLDVRAPAPSASPVAWPTTRWLALGGSLVLAGIAVVDLAVSRRRRMTVA
jgi:hypothetical protein